MTRKRAPRCIDGYVCVEVRPDGFKHFRNETAPAHLQTIWLRDAAAKKGDQGRMEYVSTPHSGFWYFRPDSQTKTKDENE